MHHKSITVLTVVILAMAAFSPRAGVNCFGTALLAQQPSAGEAKPWWNPFATTSKGEKEENVKKSSFFNGSSSEASKPFKMPSWKLPSMGFSSAKSPTSKSATPSASQKAGSKSGTSFSKFGNATKKFWSDTVTVLNPFDGPKQDRDAWGGGYRPQEPEKKGGGFFSWMKPRPKEPEVNDVNGFLGQQRPRF
jgi:hypothetical protein